MKVLVDPPKPDYARFNKQIVKTQTAGQLLNYYGDVIQRIEQSIKMSDVKKIPEMVKDVPVFKNLVYNKTYSNIFNIKLNNIHSLKTEFENGIVYLEKLTMSNRSRWLKKNFKDEIKMFTSTYKEVVVKSYYDIKASKLKYDVIFNFNGTNPSNESWFQQINGLSREKISKKELYDSIQQFVNLTESPDIKVISKAQLLDLIEESVKKKDELINEAYLTHSGISWATIRPNTLKTTLYDEGKKYYPNLQYKETFLANSIEPEMRFFVSKTNKGSFSEGGLRMLLANAKITNLLEKLRKYPISDIRFSNTTVSTYFRLNQEKFRISNHRKHNEPEAENSQYKGYDIHVSWDTDVDDALSKILELAKLLPEEKNHISKEHLLALIDESVQKNGLLPSQN